MVWDVTLGKGTLLRSGALQSTHCQLSRLLPCMVPCCCKPRRPLLHMLWEADNQMSLLYFS